MADTLHIAIVQYKIQWHKVVNNLINLETLISNLQGDTQVVILPEMFATGFSMDVATQAQEMNGEIVQWMHAMAWEYKKIIAGSVIIKEANNYYNRFIWMMPNGALHSYDKRHLFGMAGENEIYKAGDKKIIVQVNGFKINLQVCYDLRFPLWTRQNNTDEAYDVLLYVANWPAKRIAHWDALLQARAIENQCYVLACNRVGTDGNGHFYNGHSQVILPDGTIECKLEIKEGIVYACLEKAIIANTRVQLPFLKDADNFIIL